MRYAFVDSDSSTPFVAAVQPDGRLLKVGDALTAAAALRGRDAVPAPVSPLDAACDPHLASALADATETLERSGRLGEFLLPVETRLLAPVPRPTRILAIGRNYAEHAKEHGNQVFTEPIVFLKASTSVIGPGASIEIPDWVGSVEYEAELLVILGKGGKDVSEADAMGLVAGYCAFNDVTARTQQRADIERKHPWFRSKSLDTSGPMGPYLVTADDIPDPHALEIALRVNGVVKQSDTTASMVFRIPALIAFLSKWFRLYPGDVIATGTPAGVGPIVPGDVVEITISGLGTLSNPVVAA